MKLLLTIIVAIYVLRNNYIKAQTLRDFPPDIISDILTILYNGTVKVLGNCTVDVNTTQVSFWLATQQTPNYVEIQDLSVIDFGKPIIMLNHGWLGNKSVDYIILMRDAYLKRYDANIIVTDYSPYSNGSYFSAVCALPRVAEHFARFLCTLSQQINLGSIHIVGHSLGAHLAGMAAGNIQKECGKIGRITGLDPAGPLYQHANKNLRLDKSDAEFVDVIHTDAGLYGYIGNLGHVDFYPNCGKIQPGCFQVILNETSPNLLNTTMKYIVCSHERSCLLLAESVNSNSFYGTACLGCNKFICLEKPLSSHSYMGESCRSPQKNQMYFLKTNSQSPYALGPEGPLN